MDDLKEVFDLVTKRAEPDRDAWAQQERRQRQAATHRRGGALAAAAVILLFAVGAAVLVGRSHATLATPASSGGPNAGTEIEKYELSIGGGSLSPFVPSIGRPDAYWYRYSPDGSAIAFAQPDGAGVDQIWVMDADGSHARQLTSGPQRSSAPAWAPDGTTIAFQRTTANGQNTAIFTLDTATGDIARVTQLSDHAQLPTWSPHGRRIAFEWKGSVMVVDLASGEVRALIGSSAVQPVWASSGEIAWVSDPLAALQIQRADGDGSDRRIIATGNISWPHWSPDGTKLSYDVCETDDGPCSAWIYDMATGTSRRAAHGIGQISWKDDDTLIAQAQA